MKRLTKFVAAILSLSLLAAGATACQPGNGGTTSGQEESPLKNQATYDEQQQQSIKYYPYSTLVDGDYGRLRDFVKKCQAGGEVTVAAIGGSVTQGESATEPSKNYPSLIKAWLEKTYHRRRAGRARCAQQKSGLHHCGVFRQRRQQRPGQRGV